MTKTIRICDRCRQESEWLYDLYVPFIAGLTTDSNENYHFELCKDCFNSVKEITVNACEGR